MKNQEPIAYFDIGPINKSGLRSIVQLYPGPNWPPDRTKARYLQKRRLRRGREAYYWVPPRWAKRQGFKLSAEALGSDFIQANIRAELLNKFLDDWRRENSNKSIPVWTNKCSECVS